MSSAATSQPIVRVSTRSSTDYLDGLRGVLILLVLLLHIYFLTGRDSLLLGRLQGSFPWYLETFRWFYPGLFTVGLFVVVSGYCLMLPVARSADRRMTGGVLDYVRRRARRILPPYYAAALLSLGHNWLCRSEYYPWQNPFSKWDIVSHIFVFYNFNLQWRFQINGPYWSLAPEWQLYLLFPILLVPAWRILGTVGLMAASLAGTVALILSSANIRDMHPWFLWLFTVGMLAAIITESKEGWCVAWRERIPWGIVACALFGAFAVEWVVVWFRFAYIWERLIPVWQTYCLNETLLGTAIGCSIIHWTEVRRYRPMAEWPRVLQLLHHPKVMFLGRFSYSHYLVHFPILISTSALVLSFHLPLLQTMVLSFLISIPTSLGLSYLFFLAVERQFLPKRLARIEHVPAAATA